MSASSGEAAKPKIYRIVVDGKPCAMTNTAGMTEAEARQFCEDKFGPERFGGFTQ